MHNEEDEHTSEDASHTPEWFAHQSENFSSLYFGKVPEQLAKEQKAGWTAEQLSNVVALLTDPRNKEHRHEVLELLKKNDARALLVELIESKANRKHRNALIAACWETGLDFSPWLLNFARLLAGCDLATCMEIATVLEEMQGPFEGDQITQATALLMAETDAQRQAILEPALFRLKANQN